MTSFDFTLLWIFWAKNYSAACAEQHSDGIGPSQNNCGHELLKLELNPKDFLWYLRVRFTLLQYRLTRLCKNQD
jgi:hypothetical protein